jgi:hypothetical protein
LMSLAQMRTLIFLPKDSIQVYFRSKALIRRF